MKLVKTFSKIARRRYSCRSYANKPIERSKLEKILEAGRVAPSARNSQPWYTFVIQESEMKKRIESCYSRGWIKTAPVILVICGNHAKSWKRMDGKDHCDMDIGIYTDHITLAATDLGLATCWICKFDSVKCSEILDLPDHVEPMVLLPIGYPRDKVNIFRHKEQRVELLDIISWKYF